ncbi:hypothetical protein GCM10023114_45370 [Mycolicibacterium sediminis]|uniref:Lipoprotein LpqJ n=1 Tax=Mycolicibacterium sediminis TaxID=1286180 RepID=A0A7I7QNV5_9MYCO|nr:hypothetical protein MSEDJ_18060 [Mycolicibacterium sediminis]
MAALLAGCSSTTDGDPRPNAADPTEPTFPTTKPSRSSPTLPPPPSTPTPTAAPPRAAEVLPAQNGYVFIETKSGQTRCQLSEAEVACEAQFTNPPTVGGSPANGVRLTANGDEEWVVGNLGDIPVVTLDYRPYSAVGWTIDASEAGTRFVNVATGRGMFVAIEAVDVF